LKKGGKRICEEREAHSLYGGKEKGARGGKDNFSLKGEREGRLAGNPFICVLHPPYCGFREKGRGGVRVKAGKSVKGESARTFLEGSVREGNRRGGRKRGGLFFAWVREGAPWLQKRQEEEGGAHYLCARRGEESRTKNRSHSGQGCWGRGARGKVLCPDKEKKGGENTSIWVKDVSGQGFDGREVRGLGFKSNR